VLKDCQGSYHIHAPGRKRNSVIIIYLKKSYLVIGWGRFTIDANPLPDPVSDGTKKSAVPATEIDDDRIGRDQGDYLSEPVRLDDPVKNSPAGSKGTCHRPTFMRTKWYNSSNLRLVQSRITPVMKKIMESIIIPEASIANGTCRI